MKEEIKEGMSSLKKGIIATAGTMVAAVGTYVTTQFNAILGIEEESETPTEVVVPVENKQETNVNVAGPEIIINVPAQQAPAPTRTIVKETVIKEVPAEPKEEVKEEPKEETPMERLARLKRERAEKNK